jgi:hypothetical protein
MNAVALRRVGFSLLAVVLLSSGLLGIGIASTAEAAPPSDTQQHDDIYIHTNEQFNPSHGIRSGRGTKARPFVISGWNLQNIHISDTTSHLVIRDNVITGQLTLNWNDKHVTVVDNKIGDLRVNQNVQRVEAPTSGLIARNEIGVVGQLRHFDGTFTKNVVGPSTDVLNNLPFFANQTVNFDGFHGSRFVNNTVYGYVDVRLHGHHHGSNYNAASHYHAAPEVEEGEHAGHHGKKKMKAADHTQRYHKVTIANNTIHSAGPWALRYFDQAHSANDRTAASEENEALNLPHVHHTKIYMKNNKLVGSGLMVDIFNADDELHKKIGYGWMSILNNKISMTRDTMDPTRWYNGIETRTGQVMNMKIAGNTIGWTDTAGGALDDQLSDGLAGSSDAGIYMQDFDASKIKISNNKVTDFDYGVMASTFTESTKWWVKNLETKNVSNRIYYDDSVANHPNRG